MDLTKNTLDNELYHYGVVGMKWGVHRTPEELGHKKISKRKQEQQIKKNRRKASKTRRMLSDDELTRRISRLEKEKKLKELTDNDVNRGKVAVQKALKAIGKGTAKIVGPAMIGATAYAVKVAMTGEYDVKEAVKWIVPNPNVKKK